MGLDNVMLLQQRADQTRALLARRNPFIRARRDPELRKNLDRLCTAIDVVRRRRLPLDASDDERARLALVGADLAATDPCRATADSLGLLLETVDVDLAFVSDEITLGGMLLFEETRDDPPPREWQDMWSKDRRLLFGLIVSGHANKCQIKRARSTLGAWYDVRHADYALERSRFLTRARRMRVVAVTILVLVVLLILVYGRKAPSASVAQGALVALAGALGGALSLARNLRDATPRLRELRTIRSTFVLQAVLGMAAGTMTWILLQSGLIHIGNTTGTDWPVSAVAAFVAGYSEPWFLKIVEGFSGLAVTAKSEKAPAPST